MHQSARSSTAVLFNLAIATHALALGACGATQATPATAAQADEPATPVAEPRPEPPPAAPCIAESLAQYQRDSALSCWLEVDHPQQDLVDMGLGEATRAKVTARFGELGEQTLAPLLATIDEAMGPEALSAKLVAELSAHITDAQIQAMLEHAASPLGRTERMLLEVEPDQDAVAAWSEQTELGQVRSELLAEYCAASGVSSLGEVMVVAPAVGMTTALIVAVQPTRAAQREQMEAEIREQLGPGLAAFKESVCSLLAYSARSLSDAELGQVAAFYRTPEAAGYTQLQVDALSKVIAEAYASIGTAMVPVIKQAAEAE